jgi:hypothetical protein
MKLIKNIRIIETEKKLWIDRYAVVFSDTGIWQYTLEHHNNSSSSWKDDEDYIDNVRSDFLNEAGEDGQDIHTTELFIKMAQVKVLKNSDRGYGVGQILTIDCEETLPELLNEGIIEIIAC